MSSTITALTSGGGLAMAGDTSGQLELKTNNGTTAVTVTTAQNVGIGTAIPVTKLHTVSSAFTPMICESTNTESYLQLTNSGGTGYLGSVSNNLVFLTSAGGTERMRIDSSGNVGIGTTSPAAKLDFGVTSLGTNVINVRKNGNYINAIGVDSNGFTRIGCPSDAGIAFSTLSFSDGTTYTERMRIASDGTVYVGTTAQVGPAQFVVKATGNQSSFAAWNNAGTSGFFNLMSFPNNANNAIIGTIQRVNDNTITYGSTSDYRLKENVAPMTGALNKIVQLKPVTYKWKSDGSDGQGFIAHELQAIVPDCVTGEKDAMRTEQYEISPAIPATLDEEGNELTPAVEAVMGEREVPDYQGIDTSFLVATLTAAIQEQQALITDLTTRLAALEGAK